MSLMGQNQGGRIESYLMSSAVSSDMQVKREDLNACTVLLEVSCSADQVKAGFDKAVKKLGKKVRIPGFRPGLAPKKMVEEALNPQALFETAAEEIINTAYKAALEKESLEPNGYPAIDITKFEKEEPTCEFTAKVPLKPVVELAEYKGLEANKVAVSVSDEEVEQHIEEFRRRGGEKKEVTDRGVQEGDVAVVTIKVDGEEGEGRTFMIVAGQTFADLDKALTGMDTEDTKSVTLNFPESFQHKGWAGSKKKATVSVKSISAVQLPDLDDDFAKSLNTENVDDLKQKVRDGILDAKERSAEEMLRDNLLDTLLAQSKIEVADNTWEQVVRQRMDDFEREADRQQRTLEDLVSTSGMNVEEFTNNLTEEAKVNVRRAVVIEKIFTDNEMKVTNEDVGLHLTQIAMENRVPREQFEQFVKEYGPQLREEVIFRTMAAKVTDLLVEHAKITEVEAGAEEAPAPKKAKRTKKADKE